MFLARNTNGFATVYGDISQQLREMGGSAVNEIIADVADEVTEGERIRQGKTRWEFYSPVIKEYLKNHPVLAAIIIMALLCTVVCLVAVIIWGIRKMFGKGKKVKYK